MKTVLGLAALFLVMACSPVVDTDNSPTVAFGKGGKSKPPPSSGPPDPSTINFIVFDQTVYDGMWIWPNGATVSWDSTPCVGCTYIWEYRHEASGWEEWHFPTGLDEFPDNDNLKHDNICVPAHLQGETITIGDHVFWGMPDADPDPSDPNHVGHVFKQWPITLLCD